jgi:mannose-1-phosphate guanylyltransferase
MAKGRFRWDDVGSWPAIANHIAKNADGSVVVGRCESIDAEGNVVVSRERLTALIGVKDLVVVQAPHATLICPKDRAQDVKKMVDKLESDGKYRELL